MENNWEEINWIFEPDGTLRDIYVENVTIEEWMILIDFLNFNHVIRYGPTGENQLTNIIDLEYSIQYLNDKTGLMESKCASIIIDSIIINLHFFTIDQIEFDIDPREINSFEDYKKVANFMNQISEKLEKPVILTGENQIDFPLIQVDFSKKLISALTKKEAKKLWKIE
ncbi:hypothetical protein Q1W71_24090 [Flavobacterium pectinovorum]|uniref:hypothetical protein n=1 Tax=Flavobacterium pectinovorum TaxID=29533 RepID=UPI00265F912F|nr:hypothetical protein [Flavobacterium pectinovorum]WKL48016.1 hypothetical protein Q1W71_24090 [Flavobacterium pectinovorum]